MKIKKIVKIGTQDKAEDLTQFGEDSILFRIIQNDTVGRSGSNLWGSVEKNGIKRVGLYKEHNYDMPDSAYCEKLWSIVGKIILKKTRVPDIDVVKDQRYGDGLISYRIMDNDLEDMTHMTDVLFNNFQRKEKLVRQDIFSIGDILESVRAQIEDDENYAEVEHEIINVLLLDAVTNNPDRHPNNWALVRDKQTDYYELAVFDNAVSFVNMEQRDEMRNSEWFQTYIKAQEVPPKCYMGDTGDTIIKFIAANFPSYFEEFAYTFSEKLPEIIERIEQEKLPIDTARLTYKLRLRNIYLQKVLGKGEIYND